MCDGIGINGSIGRGSQHCWLRCYWQELVEVRTFSVIKRLLSSSPKLIPILGFLPAARLFFVILCYPVFSSTWGNPEVGGGDKLFGSYIMVAITVACQAYANFFTEASCWRFYEELAAPCGILSYGLSKEHISEMICLGNDGESCKS